MIHVDKNLYLSLHVVPPKVYFELVKHLKYVLFFQVDSSNRKKKSHLCWPEPTTTWNNVPLLFHEPYVNTGFRPCHQPWGAYFLSLFQVSLH